jgi:hypothetical protein
VVGRLPIAALDILEHLKGDDLLFLGFMTREMFN